MASNPMGDFNMAAVWAGLTAFVWYGFGALAARAVAATPFAVFGITSAFWAILAGIAASFMAERGELLAYWRGGTAAEDR